MKNKIISIEGTWKRFKGPLIQKAQNSPKIVQIKKPEKTSKQGSNDAQGLLTKLPKAKSLDLSFLEQGKQWLEERNARFKQVVKDFNEMQERITAQEAKFKEAQESFANSSNSVITISPPQFQPNKDLSKIQIKLPVIEEKALPEKTTIGFSGASTTYQPSGDYSRGTKVGFIQNAHQQDLSKKPSQTKQIGFLID